MKKILSIGSVIKVEGLYLMIIGYDIRNKDEKPVGGYFVTKWPIGFAGIKNLAFLEYSIEYEIVFEGYSNGEYDEYLGALYDFSVQAADITWQELTDAIHMINKNSEEAVNG